VHPPFNAWFAGLIILNGISIGSAVFVQVTVESLYFTMGIPFPLHLKVPLPTRRSGPQSDMWVLGLTRVHISNSISNSSAVFTAFMIATDRQTDRPSERLTEHASLFATIGLLNIELVTV